MGIQHSGWHGPQGALLVGCTGLAVWRCAGARFRRVGAKARHGCLIAVFCCCAVLGACGPSSDKSTDEPAGRIPAPAPRVVLTGDDREEWAPAPPKRAVVPVLLYHGVAPVSGFSKRADADLGIDPENFARQMALLDHAGYDTITLDEFVRFIEREQVSLPTRPLLLSFDGARLDSWTGSDGTLRKRGFNAVLFVDVGRVEEDDPEYLTWRELNTLQRSGRWEVQLQSGTGHHQIQYGPAPNDVGPFYAYRGSEEILGGWRERVFSDITWGEEQLAFRVRGYRPLAAGGASSGPLRASRAPTPGGPSLERAVKGRERGREVPCRRPAGGVRVSRKPSPRLHLLLLSRARSSAGERSPHTREVAGSNPAAPITSSPPPTAGPLRS